MRRETHWKIARSLAVRDGHADPKPEVKHACERARCDATFIPARVNQRFCSEKCRKLAEKQRGRARRRDSEEE